MRSFFIGAFILVTLIWTALAIARTNTTNQEQDKQAELKLGKALYDKYSCLSCHGPGGILQGNLTQAYKKFTDDQIQEYIRNANKFNNFRMPVFETIIPESDYKPLVAYVKWLGERAENK